MPSALQPDLGRLLRLEPAPRSQFDARRQAERAAEVVSRLLESEGYFLAEVTPRAEGEDVFTRSVDAVPGPQFIYGEARIDFDGPAPDEPTQTRLRQLLQPLATGTPARAQPVIDASDTMLRVLQLSGYADASGEPVDALADGRAHTIDLAFRLTAGPRVSFGEVTLSGLERTREDFILAMRPWKTGDRYTPVRLEEFRTRLSETGLFNSASVSIEPAGQDDAPAADASGNEARRIRVDLSERKRRTVTFGASASTSEGAGVEAGWELRNLSGRADSISFDAQAATLERRVSTTYRIPNLGRYGRNLRVGAEVEDLSTDAFDLSGVGVSATIEEQITPRLRGSLGGEAAYASIDDTRTRIAGGGRRDVNVLIASGTLEYTGVRDILDPRDGIRSRVVVEPGITTGDTNIAFTRLSGEISVYGSLGTDWLVAALRGRVGGIAGPPGLPPNRLFFAGGGGSVRGYNFQSLSPRDVDGNLLGGRSLVETSAELRWRATNSFGVVAFIDAGAAGEAADLPFDEMRVGAGLGVRYYAGFGPLRADIAVPLDKREGDSDFQIYISIGQAF